jgi:hypothetical protein
VEVMEMVGTAEVPVRRVKHNPLLEIFYRGHEGWMGLILTNAGDARGGHAATVATDIEAGVPGEGDAREGDPAVGGSLSQRGVRPP